MAANLGAAFHAIRGIHEPGLALFVGQGAAEFLLEDEVRSVAGQRVEIGFLVHAAGRPWEKGLEVAGAETLLPSRLIYYVHRNRIVGLVADGFNDLNVGAEV